MPPAIRVAALYVHPIKACAPLRVPRLDFRPDGRVLGDREWVVLNDEGVASWQGAHPELALLRPLLDAEELVLEAPGRAQVRLPRQLRQRSIRAGFWNDKSCSVDEFEAFDGGDEAAALLSELCGAPLRLVRLGADAQLRPLNNAVHIVSTPALAEICAGLDARRFRANVVLDGPDLQPFIEERAKAMIWTGGRMEIYAPCIRCIVPNVDPQTGAVDTRVAERVAAASAQRQPGAPSVFGVYGRMRAGRSLEEDAAVELELDF
ncbi:MAG: MOSC domain-containing protein [Paucibacter sp.]|nr:MOSC domain-containing protein [Roseateles sp.]